MNDLMPGGSSPPIPLTTAHGDKLDLGGELIQASFCAEKLMDSVYSARDVQSETPGFQNDPFHCSAPCWETSSPVERKKKCSNEFEQWKKKQVRFDKLA